MTEFEIIMTNLPTEPSIVTEYGFTILGIGLILATSYRLKSKRFLYLGLGWLLLTGLIGATGWLSDFSGTPPRIMFFFAPVLIGVAWLAFSTFGKRLCLLPLSLLVGFQSFRIIVEILIHQAAVEGVAPPQMSWDGLNFDVFAGISALIIFPFAGRLPQWAILVWNSTALGLLLWVLGVAILSFPTPFQQLKPDNIWVAHFPFIWLPTIAVALAILGHLVVFRKVLGEGQMKKT